MIELLKNIGLGIFVNGAFAWQFSNEPLKGFLATAEGLIIMAIAIHFQERRKK